MISRCLLYRPEFYNQQKIKGRHLWLRIFRQSIIFPENELRGENINTITQYFFGFICAFNPKELVSPKVTNSTNFINLFSMFEQVIHELLSVKVKNFSIYTCVSKNYEISIF